MPLFVKHHINTVNIYFNLYFIFNSNLFYFSISCLLLICPLYFEATVKMGNSYMPMGAIVADRMCNASCLRCAFFWLSGKKSVCIFELLSISIQTNVFGKNIFRIVFELFQIRKYLSLFHSRTRWIVLCKCIVTP